MKKPPVSRTFTTSAVVGIALFTVPFLHAQQEPPSVFRDRALNHEGDAVVGKRLFSSMTCNLCHSVDGSGKLAGPDLSAIGDKFRRDDLITAVLDPSSTIAVGYDQTVVTLNDGTAVAGVIKDSSDTWMDLKGPGDQPSTRVNIVDVAKRQTSHVSMMPQGLHTATDPNGFADLIAYLGSLRQRVPGDDPAEIAKASQGVKFEEFFPPEIRFNEPTWFGEIPSRPNTYIVLEHAGKSWIIEKGAERTLQHPFLDLSGVVRVGGATGLLSLAFHPRFPEDLRYFIKYQISDAGKIATIVTERRFSENLEGDSGQAVREIIRIPAATQDHNGGCIAFGPDGYLYLGMGDTGPQRDPRGHGQDRSLLLGKLLRIDIDHQDAGLAYAIPKDNPFLGQQDVRPEIWALGFREPWRFSWDEKTKDLWVGDVGQDRFEEVSIVRAGENHGWNVIEGFTPFSDRYRRAGEVYVPPVWSYARRLGVSVTGGFVYRGSQAPGLVGWYVFADHESRRVWALSQENRRMKQVIEIGQAPSRAVSLSQTKDSEIHLVGFNSGKIYHLDLSSVNLTPQVVNVIAATSERAPVESRFTLDRPQDGWTSLDFDDTGWTVSQGGFGSTGTPGTTVRPPWTTGDIWLRRSFDLPATPDAASRFVLRIHHDEDAEVFINGVDIIRLPRWTQGYTDIPLADQAFKAFRKGRNVLAIHCQQKSGGQYIDAGLMEYRKPPSKDDSSHP